MNINSRLNPSGLIDICSTAEDFDIFNSVALTNLHKLTSSSGIIKASDRADLLAGECLGTPHGISYVLFACECDIDKTDHSKAPGETYNYYNPSNLKELLDITINKNTLTILNRA